MKVLVYAHRLELGGTQTNAIELTAQARDRFGLDVTLFATPGPAAELAAGKGLRLLPAPDGLRNPSLGRMRALRAAVDRERPDLLHVWDWPQCLDALYGVAMPTRVPILCTVMSMTLARFLPRRVSLTFGTEELVARARAVRRGPVELLETPVDTTANAPGAVTLPRSSRPTGWTRTRRASSWCPGSSPSGRRPNYVGVSSSPVSARGSAVPPGCACCRRLRCLVGRPMSWCCPVLTERCWRRVRVRTPRL
ncbi:MAG: glycosyltransferase family 4 protein, partial [Mycobacterium leprae]